MKKFSKVLVSSLITTTMLLSSVSSVFASQVVKVSIGSTSANVNGYNTTLTFAPYIQQPSESMMIPLRFVSTGLGIDESNIRYNPNIKEITITYNGTIAKFIVDTNKLILNGEEFSMLIENTHPVYTEIKNGSTFIPLRSLELAFGVKIDWENSTKTAILTNIEATVQDTIKNNNVDENDEIIFLNLINDERAKYGLNPVKLSNKLMETAKEKEKDMVSKDYFGHLDPNGYNMADDLGIAENCTTASGVKTAFDRWLKSTKGHREIMLDPNIKYIGISSNTYSVLHLSSNDKWAN